MPLSRGYRGVRFADRFSWHKEETLITSAVCASPTDEDLILAGQWSGALALRLERGVQLFSSPASGSMLAPEPGIVAHYADGRCSVVAVGGQTVNVEGIMSVIRATYATGLATPTGIFCMRDGSRVCATFALKGPKNGLLSHLCILDDYRSKLKFQVGATSVDPLCDNTVASALSKDGHGWAQIRHTSSFDANVAILTSRIGEAIESGAKLRGVFDDAKRAVASEKAWKEAFDALWPEAEKDAGKRAITIANNRRDEAKAALRERINRRDNPSGSVQTLWNAATWLVNHVVGGAPRRSRGCELEAELTGSRAVRTQEILEQIQILMADGSTKEVSRAVASAEYQVPIAQALGVGSIFDLVVSPS